VATIYKRTKSDGSFTSWTKFRRDGKLIRTNTNTDVRAKAQKFLRDQLGAIEQGIAPDVDVRKVTYQQVRDNLVEHYRTTGKRREREYMKRLRHLDSFFARHRAAQITEPEITKYVAYRQAQRVRRAGGIEKPTSNSTINREVVMLLKALRLARRARVLVHVPHYELLVEPPARSGFVGQDQFELVRKHLPADLQVVAVLGYTYGMRHAEILGLDWERNIDWEAKEIRLLGADTKNGEGRALPFTDEVEVLLREQRDRIVAALGRLTACVFPYLPGLGSHVHTRLVGTRRLGFVRAWASATKAAGVPGLLFHDLRRSAVRNLIRAGVSEKVAMTISGHKTRSVLERYNVVNTDDRRAAMAKVRAFQLNGSAQ
jgi:integrase